MLDAQAKKLFPFGLLIGKRHPIVKFSSQGLDVEVSSFVTGTKAELPLDAAAITRGVSGAPLPPILHLVGSCEA